MSNYGKIGHSAIRCWHKANLQHSPSQLQVQAIHARTSTTTNKWLQNISATSHLASNANQLSSITPYNGINQGIFKNRQVI